MGKVGDSAEDGVSDSTGVATEAEVAVSGWLQPKVGCSFQCYPCC